MRNNNDLLIILRKNSSSWMTAKMLSMQLGVTERTIKNKIKSLREAGIKIKSSSQGYRYEGDKASFRKLQ